MERFLLDLSVSPVARGVASALILAAGYKLMERMGEKGYERMVQEVPRVRGFESDPVFDNDLEWRRRLCAMDHFALTSLRNPSGRWMRELSDAAARMLRIRAALTSPDAQVVALPPIVLHAVQLCAKRIFECITALENITLEMLRREMQAPDINQVSQLLGSIVAHEMQSGAKISTIPRDAIEFYKNFISLAQEIKEVTDNELIMVTRLRALRLSEGVQFSDNVPSSLLVVLEDALVLGESEMS